MRLRGTSTEEMEEEGLETDGAITSKSKLQSKIKGLSGVDILTDTGAYKSTYQILSEISEVWEDISDVDQAALLELLAGKRAGSVMSAILQNPQTLKDAFESASDATGSALEENEKYLDSIQGRMDLFTNAVQTMWNDTLDSDFLKFIVDAGTALIKLADGIDIAGHKIGNMWTTVAAIIVLITKKITKLSWGAYFNSIGTSITGLNTKLEALGIRLGLIKTTSQAAAVSQNALTAKMLETSVASEGLSASQAAQIATTNGLTMSQTSLTAAEALGILQTYGMSEADAVAILSKLNLDKSIKTLTKDELINALAAHGITDANEQAAISALFFGGAVDKASFSLKKFLSKNSILLSLAAMAAAIFVVVKLFDKWIVTLEEQEEILTEFNNALETTESKLDDLSGQLEEVKNRIDELNNQESLTFVEQEELDTLRAQSEELERQIGLNDKIRAAQQKKVNDEVLKTAQQYENANFKSGKGKEEYQQTGSTVGGIVGGIGGGVLLGGKIGAALGTFIPIPVVGNIIGFTVGAAAGAFLGGYIGDVIGGEIAERQDQVGESMDNMIQQRKKLEEEYNKAHEAYVNDPLDDKILEKYEKAEEELSKYDSMMAEHLLELDSYYSQIDLSVYDPASDAETIKQLRDEMNEFYDTQDKWAIANGGADAKNNAITRIFGKNASQELQDIKKEIEDVVTAEDWDGNLNLSDYFDPQSLDEFTARLYEMGIYIYEVENYFKDMAEAEKEAAEISLYGVVTDINKVTEGLEKLNSAFEEVLETGSVTSKTLAELNEVFGTLGDSWDNYVNAMFSGVASTKEMEEATEELAKAFIDSKILTGEAISEYERMAYIIQLRNLGVTNAEEYINDKIQENAYKAMQGSATYNEAQLKNNFSKLDKDSKTKLGLDGKTFDELSTEELKKVAEHYNMSKEINAETAQKIADEYGIEAENLQDVVGLLEEQIRLTDELTNLKEKQSKIKAMEDEIKTIDEMTDHYNKLVSKYGHESNWIAGYDLDPSQFMDAESAYNVISSDGNNYDKEEFIKDYNAWVALLSENGPYSELLARKKELEEQLSNLNIDSEGNKQAIEDLEKQIEDIDTKIEKEYTLDIELELELQNKSELVDDIQSVFDTLVEAQKEYNDEGYLSVDTLQGLLELEPKYLALLIDENGNLNLNKDTLYQVAVARITDMKLKQQDMILSEAESLAAQGTIDALYEQISATYGMSDAYDTMIEKRLKNVRAILEERKALKDGEEGKLDSSFNVDSYISSIQHQLNAVEVASRSSIDNIRNSLSSSGNTEKAEKKDALEKLQKKYEHQISNYENQQTYLQNIIDKLEAENKGVSKKYYEDQIAIEQKKLDLYTKQRTELLSLLNSTAKGTDEWFEIADALWEVEHNIQESTLSMVEFRQSIIDLYKTAFDDLDKSHGDKDNFLSDQQDYIDKYNELLELQNKPTSMASYQEQIAIEEEKMANNISELNDLRKTLADSMSSGYIKEGSEEWVEMQESIRETEAAILDNQIAIEEYKKELKSLSVEAFELVRGAFSNKNDFLTSQQDYVEGYADYLEALNVDVPAEVYDKLIEIEKEKRQNNVANLVSARAQFAEIEAQGYTAADEEWQDSYNQIIEIEKAIQDSDIAMAQWEQTLRELDFEKFERFISRLSDVRSEIDHIRNLMDGEDVAFEDGSWTEEGITSLGLLYQQIQIAKQESEAYAKQIDELNKQYEAGSISEEEYYEKLQELKEGQWDAIETYKDAEDAIVDMEEARINMIEEGINEEIEAYEELIELKKEELDAERDLYDFKKKIADQSEEIADLERKIASLAGSTDLADIAERKKLEKELRDAQEGLDDTYYTHSMDQQGQALDDELESFRDTKEEYLEMLRETLENTEELINEKISELLLNADVVLDTLDEVSEEHGVNLSGLLMKPWQDASAQSTAFKNTTEFNLDSLINEDGIVTVFSEDVKFKMAETFGASSYAAESFGTTVNTIIGQIQTTVYNSTSPLTANLRLPWENVTSQYGPINTFSTQAKGAINTALVEAQNKAQAMTNNLTSPWKAGSNAINTFSSDVRNALNQAVNDSRNAANQINSNMSSAYPSYTSSYTGNSSGSGNGSGSGGNNFDPNVKALQEVLNSVFSTGLTADGIWGPKTEAALAKVQKDIYYRMLAAGVAYLPNPNFGKHDDASYRILSHYFKMMINKAESNDHPEAVQTYVNASKKLPLAFHAKGTLGTKQDEWAITDESWIGEEITLAAGKHGQLQYLKKGSAVMPSDISANLIEWGKLDPNALSMPTMGGSVNIMSNAVIQPNYEFNFDSLVHVDHCDEGTLKGLEKMVDNKLDYFSKQLNYSLKKFAR